MSCCFLVCFVLCAVLYLKYDWVTIDNQGPIVLSTHNFATLGNTSWLVKATVYSLAVFTFSALRELLLMSTSGVSVSWSCFGGIAVYYVSKISILAQLVPLSICWSSSFLCYAVYLLNCLLPYCLILAPVSQTCWVYIKIFPDPINSLADFWKSKLPQLEVPSGPSGGIAVSAYFPGHSRVRKPEPVSYCWCEWAQWLAKVKNQNPYRLTLHSVLIGNFDGMIVYQTLCGAENFFEGKLLLIVSSISRDMLSTLG